MRGPKVGAMSSAFLLAEIIRPASFDATGRTASAPPRRMPASMSAAGVDATTPIALSGQFVQQRAQPVHEAGSKTGRRVRLPLVVLKVALRGGIVPVARNGSVVSRSALPSRYSTPVWSQNRGRLANTSSSRPRWRTVAGASPSQPALSAAAAGSASADSPDWPSPDSKACSIASRRSAATSSSSARRAVTTRRDL